MRRKVSIIILCWNRWDLTSRCLESIRRSTDLTDVDVIVIDNGSQDETPSMLREVPWIQTIHSETNLGFVRGNNLGLTLADPASDVLLLNNDTEILESSWLERLQEAAHAAPDIGIAGCRLLNPPGVLSCVGAYVLADTGRGHFIGVHEMDVGQYAADREVPTVIFAAVYIRREVLASIGHLSEAYESYCEDTDYCLRAREAGFRIICCGSVSILHRCAGSTVGQSDLLLELFERSLSTFRGIWQAKLLARYRYEVTWHSVASPAMRVSGFDPKIARELDEQGIRVTFAQDLSRLPTHVPSPEEIFDPYVDALSARECKRPGISVVFGPADSLDQGAGAYRIGFVTPEPQGDLTEVVRIGNALDEVWVTATSERDALVACGFACPVHVMPLGVDTDYFHPAAKAFRNPSGDFVFLASFEWAPRGVPEILLRVFNGAFSDREPVVLVCKVTNHELDLNLTSEVAGLGLKHRGGRIRLLVNREIPYYQLPVLYRSVDCYVSPGPTERWGLPLLEAMACGLPVITTEQAARAVGVPGGVSCLLQCREANPASGTKSCPPETPAPDPDFLASLLRRVFEHREEACEIGSRAAAFARDELSLCRSVARIRARLDEVAVAQGFGNKTARHAHLQGSGLPSYR